MRPACAQQDPAPEVLILPNQFAKGINVDYVYGGANWMLLYPPASPGTGTRPPYALARLQNLLVGDTEDSKGDFCYLRTAGFGHIRITLDPMALGMAENGANGPDFIVPNSNLLSPSPVILSLREDIKEANKQGLAVILDFHPTVIAPGHWRNQVNSVFPSANTSLTSISPAYNGTYGYHFLQAGVNGPSPLAQFWSNFVAYFDDMPSAMIGFEIMNEPMVAAWGSARWPDNTPGSSDPIVLNIAGRTGGLPNATWPGAMQGAWRTRTKEVVNAMGLDAPARANRYALVSHHDQQLEQLTWSAFPPFKPSECSAYRKLIYAFHLYNPIRFTHPDQLPNHSTIPQDVPSYMINRDFSRDSNSPAEVYLTDFKRPISEVFSLIDDWVAKSAMHPDELPNGIFTVPMVMITEFGTHRREISVQSGGPGGTVIETQINQNHMNYRVNARWAYDVRTSIASRGYGWTWYNLTNLFGYFRGSIHDATNYELHGTWSDNGGTPGDDMNLGLFSGTRP